MSGDAGRENVKVSVRVRPFSDRELEISSKQVIAMSAKAGRVTVSGNQAFQFDDVFWSQSGNDADGNAPVGQSEVHNGIGKPLVHHALAGYNACLFAYGQTGSGKTHTMMGGGLIPSVTDESRGVIPRIAEDIFSIKADLEQKEGTRWEVQCGFLEIYNEKCFDLLGDEEKVPGARRGQQAEVNLRRDPKKGVFADHQTWRPVNEAADVLSLINKGATVRHTSSTSMNSRSSRSHAVFQIALKEERVAMTEMGKSAYAGKLSKISLVDLAGSERISKSKVEGAGFEEMKNINKSLTVLGRVIDVLVEKATKTNTAFTTPPYRDSALTFLLMDSFGGNSKTYMIAAISPSEDNLDETLGTLRYASRARQIQNCAQINEDPKSRKIRELEQRLLEMEGLTQNTDPEFVTELQQKISIAQRELEEQASKMQAMELQQQRAELDRALLTATEKEKGALQSERDALSNRLNDAETAANRSRDEVQRLKDLMDDRQREMDDAKRALNERDKELATMARQLSEAKVVGRELNKTRTDMEELQRVKDTALEELKRVQEALDAAALEQTRTAEQEERMATLQQQIDEATREKLVMGNTVQELEALQKDMAAMEMDHEQEKTQLRCVHELSMIQVAESAARASLRTRESERRAEFVSETFSAVLQASWRARIESDNALTKENETLRENLETLQELLQAPAPIASVAASRQVSSAPSDSEAFEAEEASALREELEDTIEELESTKEIVTANAKVIDSLMSEVASLRAQVRDTKTQGESKRRSTMISHDAQIKRMQAEQSEKRTMFGKIASFILPMDVSQRH